MNRKRKRREESKRLPNKNMQDGMSGSRPETDYYLTESVFIIPSSINLGLCPPLHIFCLWLLNNTSSTRSASLSSRKRPAIESRKVLSGVVSLWSGGFESITQPIPALGQPQQVRPKNQTITATCHPNSGRRQRYTSFFIIILHRTLTGAVPWQWEQKP